MMLGEKYLHVLLESSSGIYDNKMKIFKSNIPLFFYTLKILPFYLCYSSSTITTIVRTAESIKGFHGIKRFLNGTSVSN